MKKDDALVQAEKIAKLILQGSGKLGYTRVGRLPLLAWLPLLERLGSKHKSFEVLDPSIDEILIFGSVARGDEEVGDLDMIILDKDFYSPFFQGKIENEASRYTDWYQSLDDNLQELLTGWFGFYEAEQVVVEALAEPVDLHVLPTSLLWNPAVREKIASRHRDPRFLQNAFSQIMRYDEITCSFEQTSLAYLETKYACDPQV